MTALSMTLSADGACEGAKFVERYEFDPNLREQCEREFSKPKPRIIGNRRIPLFTKSKISRIKRMRKELYATFMKLAKEKGLKCVKVKPCTWQEYYYYMTEFAPKHPKLVLIVDMNWWNPKPWMIIRHNARVVQYDYSTLNLHFECFHGDSLVYGDLLGGVEACVPPFKSILETAFKDPDPCALCGKPAFITLHCPRCPLAPCEHCAKIIMANTPGNFIKCPNCEYIYGKGEVNGSDRKCITHCDIASHEVENDKPPSP